MPRESSASRFGLQRGMAARVAAVGWWLAPVIFLVWLYRDGLRSWFMADDFAWLTLLGQVHNLHDLLHELFTPMAQGTIRPWSERGFFMALQFLFGLDSLPFRIVVFATAAANILLIAWVTLRATGSRVAGFVAPVLWTANAALDRAMTWNSAYNEILCPLFLLSALALFIRYAETGRRKWWWWQLVVFGLGFGALEINIVYPALAAAWVLFCWPTQQGRLAANGAGIAPRTLLRSEIPLAGLSIVYFAIHRFAASFPATGPYRLLFNGSIVKTAALYWKWSLAPEPMIRFGDSQTGAALVSIIGTLAIAAFVAAELRQRRFAVLFFLSWFAVTLAPVLPLPAHRMEYYLTIPLIGFAMLGGLAAGRYWNGSRTARVLMAAGVAVYLGGTIPVAHAESRWWVNQSLAVRTMVLGVKTAEKTHPGKAIVLSGVTSTLFNISLSDSAFAAAEIDAPYLTPESALTIHPYPGGADLDTFVLDPGVLAHGITHNDVVVYSLESDHLRNITEGYTRRTAGRMVDRLPSRVDVGNSLYSWLLGPMWLPPESGVRWMPGSATLRIGVPNEGGKQLSVEGYLPEAQLLERSRHLMVLVDGVIAGNTRIYDPETSFRRLFPIPAIPAGKTEVQLEIRVDPVERRNGQEYGLVFGKIAILP